MSFNFMYRAQGSTEYLVIFASVLVVGLVVIFLLYSQQQNSIESLVKESEAYWSSKKPLAITTFDLSYRTIGTSRFLYLNLILKNNGLEKVALRKISFKVNGLTLPIYISSNGVLPSGGSFSTSWGILLNVCQNPGELFEGREVKIEYYYPSISNSVTINQTGAIPLRDICPS